MRSVRRVITIFRFEPLITSNSSCLFRSKEKVWKQSNHVVLFGKRWNVHSLFPWIMLMALHIFGFERLHFVRNGAQISRQPWVTVETMSFRMCTSERSMACRRVVRTGYIKPWLNQVGRKKSRRVARQKKAGNLPKTSSRSLATLGTK